MRTLKLFLIPKFDGEDLGDGGIRRVVEAQHKYLPEFGITLVDSEAEADVVATHAASWVNTNKPAIAHIHGLYWQDYDWETWSYKANIEVLEAIRKADAVTAPSEWVRMAIARNTWVQSDVVYHGVDVADWPVGAGGADGLGYVLWNKTRNDPVCDPGALVELAKRMPDVQFVTTFGEHTDNVRVVGRLSYDLSRSAVQKASVYLATTRETFGIGTIEAMAAGVPVVGWAWGGQTEIVTHKTDGWLARPGDFDSLVEGVRYCLEHRKELGSAARARVGLDFTWRAAAERYAAIYRRVFEDRERQQQGPRISVVVPCYNLAEYLPKAVESIIGRYKGRGGSNGGSGCEVIIVDDASTDNTLEIAQRLVERSTQDVSIRVVHNEQNQYLAGALNVGISASSGLYVVPLDADNELGPTALETLADALDKDRGLDIAYGAMQVLESDGREWISSWPSGFQFEMQMSHHNQIPSTSMYRRRVWERVGGYRRRCRTGEDADFWCRATSYGARAAKVTDAVVLRYRDRHDSMSHTVKDWPWEKWYPWSKDITASPPVAPVVGAERRVATYDPPLISVVIPVGPGHGRLMVDALDSLVAQTFTRWEAIVVNDSGGPLDWVPPWVTVLGAPNRGNAHTREGSGVGRVAANRNAGISCARGRFFVPLDADDYLQPEALTLMYKAWQEIKGGKGYVYGDWVVQETGEVKETDEWDCQGALKKLLHAVTALYPKSAWEAVGGFDETLGGWEDWDFCIALMDKDYCGVRVDTPLMQYRMSAGSRREELYGAKDVHEAEIAHKWAKYIIRGETPMACGGCQKSAGSVSGNGGSNAAAFQGPPQDNMVLVEYTGPISGPTTFKGAKTGTAYRFGSIPSHKVKYVYADDATHFIATGLFSAARERTELLQAAGR